MKRSATLPPDLIRDQATGVDRESPTLLGLFGSLSGLFFLDVAEGLVSGLVGDE